MGKRKKINHQTIAENLRVWYETEHEYGIDFMTIHESEDGNYVEYEINGKCRGTLIAEDCRRMGPVRHLIDF